MGLSDPSKSQQTKPNGQLRRKKLRSIGFLDSPLKNVQENGTLPKNDNYDSANKIIKNNYKTIDQ